MSNDPRTADPVTARSGGPTTNEHLSFNGDSPGGATGAGGVSAPAAPPVDPGPVWGIIQGLASYWLVVAALDLGVFDDLAAGRALSIDGPKVASLLDGLVALGLVTRVRPGGPSETSGPYQLTPVAETYLVSDPPRSMAALVRHSPGPLENWTGLAETVRSGGPPPCPVGADGAFHAHLVAATFPTQYAVARVTVAGLGPVSAVLDIGAGSAPWAIAVLEANPSANAIIVDLPEVIPVARAAAARHGVIDRCRFVEGDYLSVELPPADLVVLGHVCRAEPPERASSLIAAAAAAIIPGPGPDPKGHLAITDYFVDDDRSGPAQALLMGATMAAATAGGTTYSSGQFRAWLAAAGLDAIEIVRPLPFQDVLIATIKRRPGES